MLRSILCLYKISIPVQIQGAVTRSDLPLHKIALSIFRLGLAHKTPLLLMVRKLFGDTGHGDELITVDESYLLPDRFVGLTAEHFNKHFRHDDSLYKFYDREFNVVIIRQKCKVWFERVRPETARRLQMPEHMEVLRTDRVSYDITKQPIEYRINRGRARCTQVSFDVMI